MARFVLAALLAVLAAPANAGPCGIPMMVATPMTAANTTIAPGGGVLVTLMPGGYGGDPKAQGLEQKGWRFKAADGKLHAPAKIETLAPGLAVYQLPAEGDQLVDDKGKALVAVKRSTAEVPALAAPAIKAITHITTTHQSMHGGYQSRKMTVKLASPPPADAKGIILYNGATAVSWTHLIPDAMKDTEFTVYVGGGRCSIQIPGQTDVAVGGRATIAWVDASGRVSPKSKELVVVKGKPAPPPPGSIGP
jgi:hypothetical protein